MLSEGKFTGYYMNTNLFHSQLRKINSMLNKLIEEKETATPFKISVVIGQ